MIEVIIEAERISDKHTNYTGICFDFDPPLKSSKAFSTIEKLKDDMASQIKEKLKEELSNF